MDMRLTFNTDAASYNRFRPTYTESLFDDVIWFSNLRGNKQALEIGIGTGQATLPFLKTNCKITAIEIGDNLARYARDKFMKFKGFEVINQDFESVQLNANAYDLIYSASAFHWIPQEVGLPKVQRLLKKGGVFAWFSNQPAPAEEHTYIHEEFQKVYSKHTRFFGEKSSLSNLQYWQHQAEEKRLNRSNILKQYGFEDVIDKIYYSSRTFNANDYATLISTYSDHKAMPEEIRIPFLREISDIINCNGGKFTLVDIIILNMGKKQ